jgi:antitoxin VapB
MAFHVRDPATDSKVRELARKRGVGLTEAIKQAVEAELERVAHPSSFMEEVRRIQANLASHGRTGLVADKAFFDDLSGQGDDE